MTTRFPGLGDRMSERLRTLGFWKDGHPDVGRFCREKGYRPQYVYAWLKNRMPAYDNMQRLCTDLDVPVVWFVGGEEHAAETRITRPDHARGHRRDRANGPIAQPLVSLDLAPLLRATEHIASLQADLRALLAAFPDPCWWIDERGRVLDLNGAADEAARAAAVGRTIREAFPAAATAALQRGLTEALRSNSVTTVEYTVPAAGGRRGRAYEARIRPVVERANRRSRKALVVVRDVSERHARETELRELVEGSSNGLCIHRDFIIEYANRGLARMLAYDTPAELVGRDVRELVPGLPAPESSGRSSVEPRRHAEVVTRDGGRIEVLLLRRNITWRSETASLLTLVPATPPRRA